MNLYVFLVDTGSTFNFDINLSLTDVKTLKKAIAERAGIPEDKQSLLISGGETLHQDARICSYRAAGTETNPIFLFNRQNIESDTPPSPTVDYGMDVDMKDRIDSCLNMEPSYNTVVSRAELAQQLREIAEQQLSICERLVQDQHLQHQGWAAVIANLEDKGKELITKIAVLSVEHVKFTKEKDAHFKLIESVDYDLEILSKIPLLPSVTSPVLKAQIEKPSLLDWIGSQGSHMELKGLAEHCSDFLRNNLDNAMANLEERSKVLTSEIGKRDMKEIRGLQTRLQGLDTLISAAKKIVAELDDLAKAFYQNQQRASNLRDPSIFPDLCKSHETQLKLMSDKYQELRAIRDKCINAKKEFCVVVHRRLQWVLFVSKQNAEIYKAQEMLLVQCKRMRQYIEVFHQLHKAPETYFTFLGEVIRRRHVSKRFLEWANEVSTCSSSFLTNEKALRKEFTSKVSNHFLHKVFPGMDDQPPDFAQNPPPEFDINLPEVECAELKQLEALFPQFSSLLSVPSDVPLEPPRLSSPIEESNISSPRRNESENDDFETVTTTSVHEPKPEPISVKTIGCDPMPEISTKDESVNTDKIQLIDAIIQAKISSPNKPDEVGMKECKEAVAKLPEVPTSSTGSASQQPSDFSHLEKISILSCEVGDIVLITYHEKYKSYIVFSLNPTVHFVKTACLPELKLNTGSERRDWTLAVVTSKMYCQAARTQNRYNVPINTKFFCVEAKLWEKISLYRNPPSMAHSTTERGIVNRSERLSQSQSPLASSVSILSFPSPKSPPSTPE